MILSVKSVSEHNKLKVNNRDREILQNSGEYEGGEFQQDPAASNC